MAQLMVACACLAIAANQLCAHVAPHGKDSSAEHSLHLISDTITWKEAKRRCAAQNMRLSALAVKRQDRDRAAALVQQRRIFKPLWVDGHRQHRRCSCLWHLDGLKRTVEVTPTTGSINENSKLAKNECLRYSLKRGVQPAVCTHYAAGALCESTQTRLATVPAMPEPLDKVAAPGGIASHTNLPALTSTFVLLASVGMTGSLLVVLFLLKKYR